MRMDHSSNYKLKFYNIIYIQQPQPELITFTNFFGIYIFQNRLRMVICFIFYHPLNHNIIELCTDSNNILIVIIVMVELS